MEKEIFDLNSNSYDTWLNTKLGKHIYDLELQALFKAIVIKPNQCVLEIGVGTGNIAKELLKRGASVTGIDVSKKMLEVAKKKFESNEIELYHMNAENISFPNASFDTTVAVTSLEFIEDIKVAIHEIKRITKPYGQIVIGFLNRGSKWVDLYQSEEMKGSVYDFATFYTKKDLEKLFSLPVNDYHETLFTPPKLLDEAYSIDSNSFYESQGEIGGFAVI